MDDCDRCGHSRYAHETDLLGRCRWQPSRIGMIGYCACLGYRPPKEPQESPGAPGRTLDDLVAGFIAEAFSGVLRDYWMRGHVVVEEMAAQAEQHLADWARGMVQDLDPQPVDEPVDTYDWITDPNLSAEQKRAIFEDLIAVQVAPPVEEPQVTAFETAYDEVIARERPDHDWCYLPAVRAGLAAAQPKPYPYKVLRERLEAARHECSDKIEHQDGAVRRTRLNGMMQAYVHAIDLLDSLVPKED